MLVLLTILGTKHCSRQSLQGDILNGCQEECDQQDQPAQDWEEHYQEGAEQLFRTKGLAKQGKQGRLLSASEGACRGGPGQQGEDMKEIQSCCCYEVNYIDEGIRVCRDVAHIGGGWC